MIGQSDLDVYLNDFGQECAIPGPNVVKVLFDVSDSETLNGRVISGDAMITGKTSEIGNLTKGTEISIGADTYKVQSPPRRIDDGVFCEIELTEQ